MIFKVSRSTIWQPLGVAIALLLAAVVWLAGGAIATAAVPPESSVAVDSVVPEQSKPEPLSTYYLSLLPDGARRRVNFDAPASQLSVSLESGNTSVRCGDGEKTYSCVPGKSLEIQHRPDRPIKLFWAENSNGDSVRLRIDIYEYGTLEETASPP